MALRLGVCESRPQPIPAWMASLKYSAFNRSKIACRSQPLAFISNISSGTAGKEGRTLASRNDWINDL